MKQENAFRTVNTGLFLTALGMLAWTAAIPGGTSGRLLLGLSPVRLGLVLLFALIACLLLWMVMQPGRWLTLLSRLSFKPAHFTALQCVLLCAGTLFWITLWLPARNLLALSDEFTRLRPLLLTIELIGLTWLTFFNWQALHETYKIPTLSRKWRLPALCLLGVGLAFLTLKWTLPAVTEGSIVETPGTPITPLQLVICLFVFGLARLVTRSKSTELKPGKAAGIVAFLGIWAATAAVWALTPFPCGVDRPGPYPPFGNCYPQVKDAVYSIGSHYITLGQGVLNHWPTDKPFYILFLAIGQWLAGPEISKYLLFQVIIVAAAPALLYLLVRKMAGNAAALFITLLLACTGFNAIRLNASLGVVNVWFENTEGLTGLLLLLTGLALFNYFANGRKNALLLLAGGLLGLAALTRMNPVFILPVLLILLVVVNWRNRRKLLLSLATLLLGFCIVFLPWAVSARDADGSNFYCSKIQRVLQVRYEGSAKSIESGVNPAGILAAPIPTAYSVSYSASSKESTSGSLLFHFTNNELTSLLKLPVNLSLLSLADVTHQLPWKNAADSSFFRGKLTAVNLTLLLLNICVTLTGLWWACKRWKIAGVIPLIIQIGYNLGNAAAQTSGGRYLEPTFWVTLLYFVLGVVAIGSTFRKTVAEPWTALPVQTANTPSRSSFLRIAAVLMILGALLPLTNLVPSRLTDAGAETSLAQARTALVDGGYMSTAEFDALLDSPRAVIGSGFAYHLRFYDSPVFPGSDEKLELTLLGADNAYISFSPRFAGFKSIRTEDHLIVLGCNYTQGVSDYWGVQAVLLRTLAILRVDQQTGAVEVLKAPGENAVCQK